MGQRIAAVDGRVKAVDKHHGNGQKVSNNVGQRTSTVCSHRSPFIGRSFTNTDAFHRVNGVHDSDVFLL